MFNIYLISFVVLLSYGCEVKEAKNFEVHVNNMEEKTNFKDSLSTDELMHLFDDSVLNLRIRMPITDELNPRNFITKITTYDHICSMPNAMTVLDELLPYVLDMAKNNKTGTINLTNPGLISHNEILEMFKEIVEPSFTWKNFTPEEQAKILAADRSNNCLDTTKLSSMYPEIKNIKESIRDTLIRMKKKLD